MSYWLTAVQLLAEGEPPAAQQPSELTFLVPAAFTLFLLWLVVLRPQQKQQARELAKHKAMLDALKKHDRVATVGGIIGTVDNISPDGTEVTLKVDDKTNTRIRVLRSGIQQVLASEPVADAAGGIAVR